MVSNRSPKNRSDVQRMQREVRALGRRARANLNRDEREHASEIIAEKVVYSPWFRRAKCVASYLPTSNEVDTWSIIARAWQMKKRIFVPIIKKNCEMAFRELRVDSDVFRNRVGIYEPGDGEQVSARHLDLVLTPVVAFDAALHRVGMGGGYFDRTFSFLMHRQRYFHPKLLGLSFACQKVARIFPNPWDMRLCGVITESE